jgi:hypothetical protein
MDEDGQGTVPNVYLLEEGSSAEEAEFAIPLLETRILFDSVDDRDAFGMIYDDAWHLEQGLKMAESEGIVAALKDQIEGEGKLLDLRLEDVDATSAWFTERESDGDLFGSCFASVGGARRDALFAQNRIAAGRGPFESGQASTSFWNLRPEPLPASVDGHELTREVQQELALAAATDVEQLKQGLGGLDAKSLVIDCAALPKPEVMLRSFDEGGAAGGMNLLDIAAQHNLIASGSWLGSAGWTHRRSRCVRR